MIPNSSFTIDQSLNASLFSLDLEAYHYHYCKENEWYTDDNMWHVSTTYFRNIILLSFVVVKQRLNNIAETRDPRSSIV